MPVVLLMVSGILRVPALGALNFAAAVVVGVCSRPLAERFSLTVVISGKRIRCGLKPLLEIADARGDSIRWDEFNAVRRFIGRHAGSKTVEWVRATALENIAPGLAEADVAKFRRDIAAALNVVDAFECYLRFAGRRSFDRVFGDEIDAAPAERPRFAV